MTEALIEDLSGGLGSFIGAHECPDLLGIPAGTVRGWAAQGKLNSRALDNNNRPLYLRRDVEALKDATRRRRKIANSGGGVVTSLQTDKLSPHSALAPYGPGASSFLEGFAVAEPPAETRVVRLLMRPELDPVAVELFKAQVAELAAATTATLANAVTSGLKFDGLTVHMNGPIEPPV